MSAANGPPKTNSVSNSTEHVNKNSNPPVSKSSLLPTTTVINENKSSRNQGVNSTLASSNPSNSSGVVESNSKQMQEPSQSYKNLPNGATNIQIANAQEATNGQESNVRSSTAQATKSQNSVPGAQLPSMTSPVKTLGGSSGANPPLSMAKKATKFEIISVQEVENADENDDGEESGEDAEDSISELNSNQSRGSFSLEENSKDIAQTLANSNAQRAEQEHSRKISTTSLSSNNGFLDSGKVAGSQQGKGLDGSHVSKDFSSISGQSSTSHMVYSRTNSDELLHSGGNNASNVYSTSASNLSRSQQQAATSTNQKRATELTTSFNAHGQMVGSDVNFSKGSPPNGLVDESNLGSNQHHSNPFLNAIPNQNSSSLSSYANGTTQIASVNYTTNGSTNHVSQNQQQQQASHILPSRFRVVKKVKPFAGKRGRWECKDVPCDVIMRSTSGAAGTATNQTTNNSNHPTIGAQGALAGQGAINLEQQVYNASAALSRVVSQQVPTSNNSSFALTEDTNKNNPLIHVPVVSHVTSSGSGNQPGGGGRGVLDQQQLGFQPITSLDEALSNAVANELQIQEQKVTATSSFEHDEGGSGAISLGIGDVGKLGGGSGATLLDPDDARGGAGGGTTGDETSERGMLEEVTGKLTQVMELVKSHVILTVQEEFELVRDDLEKARKLNLQLEKENSILRQQQQQGASKKKDVAVQVGTQDGTNACCGKSEKFEENPTSDQITPVFPNSVSPAAAALNMPYVLLGIQNVPNPNMQVNYAPSNLGQLGSTAGVDFQQNAAFHTRSAQLQSAVGYYPMSAVLQNASSIPPPLPQMVPDNSHKHSLQTDEQGQLSSNSSVIGSLDFTATTLGSHLHSSQVNFANKAGSDSGRSSLEPLKERTQSIDSVSQHTNSDLALNITSGSQTSRDSTLNFISNSSKNKLVGSQTSSSGSSSGSVASFVPTQQTGSTGAGGSVVSMEMSNQNSATIPINMSQQQSGLTMSGHLAASGGPVQTSTFASITPQSGPAGYNIAANQTHLIPGQPVQQQQLFYMPQVAIQPIHSAPTTAGVNFSMVHQMPGQPGMFLPHANMVAAASTQNTPANALQHQPTPAGLIPGNPGAGNPFGHPVVNTGALGIFGGNGTGLTPMYIPQAAQQQLNAPAFVAPNPALLPSTVHPGTLGQVASAGDPSQVQATLSDPKSSASLPLAGSAVSHTYGHGSMGYSSNLQSIARQLMNSANPPS